jgi:hypothetical protein
VGRLVVNGKSEVSAELAPDAGSRTTSGARKKRRPKIEPIIARAQWINELNSLGRGALTPAGDLSAFSRRRA